MRPERLHCFFHESRLIRVIDRLSPFSWVRGSLF